MHFSKMTSTVGVLGAFLVAVAQVQASSVTTGASNDSGGGLSYSWLHTARKSQGGPDGGGFYLNADKSQFLPFEFIGEWDGSVLTINMTTQVGDTLDFVGGALEQLLGTNTTAASYDGHSVILTSNGYHPSSGLPLGVDLLAAGIYTTIAPIPISVWSGIGLLAILAAMRFRRSRKRIA